MAFYDPYDPTRALTNPAAQLSAQRAAEQSATGKFRQGNLQQTQQSGNLQTRDTASRGESKAGQTGPVNSAIYQGSADSLVSNPNTWYGRDLNQYGQQSAADNAGQFWDFYGQNAMGWEPAGGASTFMASVFDPFAMGAALYGGEDFSSVEERLAGGSALADQLSGPNGGFVDPAQIVSNVITGLANGDENLAFVIRAINEANVGNPAGQMQGLISFFQNALRGSMPSDVLEAFTAVLENAGRQFISSMGKGDLSNLDTANFAKYLMQQMGGPTLGL